MVTGNGSFAQLWDATTGQPIGKAMRHRGDVRSVAFSPDGRIILTGTMENLSTRYIPDGRIIVRGTMENLRTRYIDDDEIIHIDTRDEEASVWLWDAASGLLLAKPVEHQGGVDEVAFARAGKSIFIRYVDGTARLWDAAARPQVGRPLEYDGWVSAVAFSPDGKSILTGNLDGTAGFGMRGLDGSSEV